MSCQCTIGIILPLTWVIGTYYSLLNSTVAEQLQ